MVFGCMMMIDGYTVGEHLILGDKHQYVNKKRMNKLCWWVKEDLSQNVLGG